MVSTFYLVLFIVSFIYLVVFMIEFSQHVSVFYPLLCLAILVMNFGYWQISIADTVEAASFPTKLFTSGQVSSICSWWPVLRKSARQRYRGS